MSGKHKKKRNCGLLFEWLVRAVSAGLVEQDQRRSAAALKIMQDAFKPGTELHRELRLFNALVATTVSSEAVAANILSEAKLAARQHDVAKLDREKSLLIRNINHVLSDPDFFDQPIREYRTFAAVSILLDDWRSASPDLARVARHEDVLLKHLTTEKFQPSADQADDRGSPGMNRLVFKVMAKKLNDKYAGVLTEGQRVLVREYAFFSRSGDPSSIKKRLQEVRDGALTALDGYARAHARDLVTGSQTPLGEKLSTVREQLQAETLEQIDDDAVARFMLYSKLSDELATEE